MRILGIDPGLRTTGFGVIEADGPRLHYVASGTIKTDAVDIGQLPARLKIIFDGVRKVAACATRRSARPWRSCSSTSIRESTLLLGQARGAALTALVSTDLDVSEYTALQMKKAIVGHGQARKEQVQEMVMRLLCAAGPAGQGRGRRARARHLPRTRRRVLRRHGQGHDAAAAHPRPLSQGSDLLRRAFLAPGRDGPHASEGRPRPAFGDNGADVCTLSKTPASSSPGA